MQRRFFVRFAFVFIGVIQTSATFAQEEANDELVQLVVGLLHESDKDLRAVAFEQVRTEAKGAAATRLFAAELAKMTPEGQVGLLAALAARGDAAARPQVLETLSATADDNVKAAAIQSLGALGEATDVKLLAKLLSDGTKPIADAARASLVQVPGEGVSKAIVHAMLSSGPQVRASLIEVLAERRALDSIPDLLAFAVCREKMTRSAAMKALGQVAGPEHIVKMLPGVILAEAGAEREAAEKAVMFVCQRIENPEDRAEPILAAMEDMNETDRRTILSALGRVGGSGALKIIEQAIADQNADAHAAGMRALCNWPDASIAAQLIQLTKDDAHGEHRTAALRALIRVSPLADDRTDEERLELLRQAMQLATRDDERLLALQRARAVRTVETLRFALQHLEQPAFAQMACETIVELAHHRALRDAHKPEFHAALDRVIATSKDAVVVDRAQRYKKGQTWVRPKPAAP